MSRAVPLAVHSLAALQTRCAPCQGNYPTLRARLTDIIRTMGFTVGPEPTLISDEERHRILDDLASGKLSSEEAMRLLEGS